MAGKWVVAGVHRVMPPPTSASSEAGCTDKKVLLTLARAREWEGASSARL